MKKVIFLLCAMVITVCSQAQYIIAQGIGNAIGTMITMGGGLTVKGGIVYHDFSDTTTANLDPFVKFTPNIVILTGINMWKRNLSATTWLLISSGSAGGPSTTDVIGEINTGSTSATFTLAHIPFNSSIKLLKNGIRLPTFKYSITGALVTLVDARLSIDVFESDYKF